MSKPSIFITGAGAGIGRATAELFASRGWFVGLYDVDEAGVRDLQAQLGDGSAIAGRLDVTDAAAWRPALDEFWGAAGGRLDVLFNNAGIAATDEFEAIPLARHHAVVDVNLKGVINGCYSAFDYLKRTDGARIINMCSASAIYGQPKLATYAATKAAVASLTEGLSIEWRPYGIQVMDIWPLFVDTAMVREEVRKLKSVQTLGVRLKPEDVAATAWRAAQAGNGALHWPLGWQTHIFYVLTKLLPDRLNHWMAIRMAQG